MNRRSTAHVLLISAVAIFCIRYLSLAILCSNLPAPVISFNYELNSFLPQLKIISSIIVSIALFFLTIAEIEGKRK